MNTVNSLLNQVATDPNVSLSFKTALRGNRCTDCGTDIEGAGQEVKYIKGNPYCEDCFDARVREEQKFNSDTKQFEDSLRGQI